MVRTVQVKQELSTPWLWIRSISFAESNIEVRKNEIRRERMFEKFQRRNEGEEVDLNGNVFCSK